MIHAWTKKIKINKNKQTKNSTQLDIRLWAEYLSPFSLLSQHCAMLLSLLQVSAVLFVYILKRVFVLVLAYIFILMWSAVPICLPTSTFCSRHTTYLLSVFLHYRAFFNLVLQVLLVFVPDYGFCRFDAAFLFIDPSLQQRPVHRRPVPWELSRNHLGVIRRLRLLPAKCLQLSYNICWSTVVWTDKSLPKPFLRCLNVWAAFLNPHWAPRTVCWSFQWDLSNKPSDH